MDLGGNWAWVCRAARDFWYAIGQNIRGLYEIAPTPTGQRARSPMAGGRLPTGAKESTGVGMKAPQVTLASQSA
jgi:hypothetical protein